MRRFFFGSLVLVALTLPQLAGAALVPEACSGNLAPSACGTCEVIDLANNVFNFIIGIASGIAVLLFMFAGFTLVTSGGSQEKATKAKSIFTNVAIGYVIMLSAWLIVNLIIGSLVDKDSKLLNWSSIECLYAKTPENKIVDETLGVTAGRLADAAVSPGDCSPDALKKVGITDEKMANTLSCIAGAESGCANGAMNIKSGGFTSAGGTFQIVRGFSDDCHSLNLPACVNVARAAGYSAVIDGERMNCSKAFSGGGSPSNPSRATPGMEKLYEACNAAVQNFACNAQAAKCLVDRNKGSYRDWLGDPKKDEHKQQRACVAKYAS